MTYEWNVVNLDRKTDNGFVITVHYEVSAVDGEFTASTYGTVGFTQESEDFTPFEELTQSEVIEWVQDSLGKDTVEDLLAERIATKKAPAQESGLPW